MLDKVNLKKTMMDPEYKQLTKSLKHELNLLQHAVKERGLPVIVLFEGWGTAGKGSMISDIILNLDPRNFKVHSTVDPTPEEKRKPFLWRHWTRVPPKGLFAFFDRSWYPEVSAARLEEKMEDEEYLRRIASIQTFERQLTDNGTVLIKFFLHLSQKEQAKRLQRLEKNADTAWRATKLDWKRNERYSRYFEAFDDMLTRTDTSWAPWHIISAQDHNSARAEVYQTLVETLQGAVEAFDRRKTEAQPFVTADPGPFTFVKAPALEEVRLDMTVEEEEYKALLKKFQKKLEKLHNRIYFRRIPVIVVYEGWDAAGKGGNIRRIAAALDPRGYEVVPIAAPTPAELAHHYLWRFWRELPKDGHVSIFDRSWYGRVMVERIEGFCTKEEWSRAYREMNEFEKELHDWGAVLVKFWLQIDSDEQLRRFTDRQNTPEKQWKITDEDWRNREKWDRYEVAVNEMLQKTSTDFAPWTIIESQDKRFARLKALKTLIQAIEARL
ncbi:MAG: polyphosphate:AMP phosphotransferase [Provencibacterium sp.]|jgi:polyphosphate:AMP phosphotransferase|nr:polyphosphate:AMP phosphotransferase [Provencibacterium sp.]